MAVKVLHLTSKLKSWPAKKVLLSIDLYLLVICTREWGEVMWNTEELRRKVEPESPIGDRIVQG